MHGIGGDFSDHVEILHELDGDWPVIGVRARGHTGDRPDNGLEAMARHSAARLNGDLRAGQPAAIAGYSFGALLAIEFARTLHSQGIQVPPVVLIDPPILPNAQRNRLARLRGEIRAALGLRSGTIDEAHLLAAKRYRPRPLALDRVLLVRSRAFASDECGAHWNRLLGPGVQTETIDCDHLSLRHAPNARLVSRLISNWLA